MKKIIVSNLNPFIIWFITPTDFYQFLSHFIDFTPFKFCGFMGSPTGSLRVAPLCPGLLSIHAAPTLTCSRAPSGVTRLVEATACSSSSQPGWMRPCQINFPAQPRTPPAASLLSSHLHPSLYTTPMLTDLPILLSRLEKTLKLCYPGWVGFFYFILDQ